MTTLWRTSWRDPGYESVERHADHISEGAAQEHANKLERKGVVAVVYALGEVDDA